MGVDLIVEDNGKKRKKTDLDFTDQILKLKNAKDHWAVIDLLLRRWLSDTPEEVEALKIEIADHRELLTDKEFGTTAGGKDLDRRFTLVFPRKLMLMIRAIYSSEELKFDSDFYRDFAKRYSQFKVAQKQ